MKILILSKDMSFSVTGGQIVNKRVYDLLSKEGHEVIYCQQLHPTMGNFRYLFSLIFHLFEYLKYDRIIIDSSSFPKTVWFVTLANIFGYKKKLVTTLHHYGFIGSCGLKGYIYKFLELSFVRQCEMVIIFSPYVLDLSQKLIKKSRLFFVGLPFDKHIKSKAEHQYGNMLFVGTIEERKGLVYLIDALVRLPDEYKSKVHLDIVGKVIDENYYNMLTSKITDANMGQLISFKGRVGEEELDTLYSTSMIFAFPSLYEGFGMVLIEAMGHSLPVIAFNNSAIPYTVKDGVNGILVNNMDSNAFSDAIVLLLNDTDLYRNLSLEARKTYEQSKSYEEFDRDVVKLFA